MNENGTRWAPVRKPLRMTGGTLPWGMDPSDIKVGVTAIRVLTDLGKSGQLDGIAQLAATADAIVRDPAYDPGSEASYSEANLSDIPDFILSQGERRLVDEIAKEIGEHAERVDYYLNSPLSAGGKTWDNWAAAVDAWVKEGDPDARAAAFKAIEKASKSIAAMNSSRSDIADIIQGAINQYLRDLANSQRNEDGSLMCTTGTKTACESGVLTHCPPPLRTVECHLEDWTGGEPHLIDESDGGGGGGGGSPEEASEDEDKAPSIGVGTQDLEDDDREDWYEVIRKRDMKALPPIGSSTQGNVGAVVQDPPRAAPQVEPADAAAKGPARVRASVVPVAAPEDMLVGAFPSVVPSDAPTVTPLGGDADASRRTLSTDPRALQTPTASAPASPPSQALPSAPTASPMYGSTLAANLTLGSTVPSASTSIGSLRIVASVSNAPSAVPVLPEHEETTSSERKRNCIQELWSAFAEYERDRNALATAKRVRRSLIALGWSESDLRTRFWSLAQRNPVDAHHYAKWALGALLDACLGLTVPVTREPAPPTQPSYADPGHQDTRTSARRKRVPCDEILARLGSRAFLPVNKVLYLLQHMVQVPGLMRMAPSPIRPDAVLWSTSEAERIGEMLESMLKAYCYGLRIDGHVYYVTSGGQVVGRSNSLTEPPCEIDCRVTSADRDGDFLENLGEAAGDALTGFVDALAALGGAVEGLFDNESDRADVIARLNRLARMLTTGNLGAEGRWLAQRELTYLGARASKFGDFLLSVGEGAFVSMCEFLQTLCRGLQGDNKAIARLTVLVASILAGAAALKGARSIARRRGGRASINDNTPDVPDSARPPASRHTGGETAATRRGRQAHKDWDPGPGYRKEFTLPSGKRADAVDFTKREVVELKPNNPRAIREGKRQVETYRRELEDMTGEPWTARVETYEP